MTDKIEFLMQVQSAFHERMKKIMEEKQAIPWASSKTGPCFAVTTFNVGWQLEELEREVRDLTRNFAIVKNDGT